MCFSLGFAFWDEGLEAEEGVMACSLLLVSEIFFLTEAFLKCVMSEYYI